MKFRLTIIACLLSFFAFSQLKSPDEFLGYSLGSKFSYHFQLVQYCKYIAQERSAIAKWQSYGVTNEGRELGMLILTNPNLPISLDQVKDYHHQVVQGQRIASLDAPVIINLSFNVHGNEAAGSEAALGALYDLIKNDGLLSNTTKNIIVLIDPCINPDGRDAYVTQYNRRLFTVGGNADPNDQEHFEGPVSGRHNHFSFDLNRDWVWQTQVETKQRLAFFKTWLPMVHADFHEQSYQHSYYFPPAAKPYLNFISNSTKDLQSSVGKSFARLFDKQKWPYFTSEVYDLFYPGYGDTYPILNGALGMTLEQGGIRGGLQAQKSNLDTIRLADRVNHHRQLATNLVEWAITSSDSVKASFYQNHTIARVNPSNLFKSYIIPQQELIKSVDLLQILQANRIQIGQVEKDLQVNAFSYYDQKTLPLKISKGDLIVSAYQSAAPMIQALLDPTPVLEDSVTYDITAWNLFQMHGIRAFGVKERLPSVNFTKSLWKDNVIDETNVSYVFSPTKTSSNFVNQLIKRGYIVLYNDKEVGFVGKKYTPGHLWVIKKKGNWDALKLLANENEISIHGVSTFRSDFGADLGSTHFIHINTKRLAVVVDATFDINQQGELAFYLTEKMKMGPSFIPLGQLFKSNLSTYSHILLPNNKSFEISKNQKVILDDYVRKGGIVILFENAASLIIEKDIALLTKDLSDSSAVQVNYENIERQEISKTLSGNLVVANLEKTNPLGFRINQDKIIVINQTDELRNLNLNWKTILKTSSKTTFFGFIGNRVKSKLDNSLLLASYSIGLGNYIWFGFNPVFRAIPNQTTTLFENAILYYAN